MLFFEDFHPGATSEAGAYAVTREEILAFAHDYDPQPFHLDEAAAKASILGGLAASGWHTCAMTMRIIADHLLRDAAALGSPGIMEVKWLRPVKPGDVLSVRYTVLSTRASRTRPAMGLVEFSFDVLNRSRDILMTQRNVIMLRRQGFGPETLDLPPPAQKTAEQEPVQADDIDLPFFEDIVVGTHNEFGAHAFTREAIVTFARAYDPQPFHLDEDAGRAGPFGALAASGWHTGACWMRARVDWYNQRADHMRARGVEPPTAGPSPGFHDLRWLRPVFVGDTIRYAATITGARASQSRPQWGLVSHHATGTNQHGVRVFEFSSAAFLQRRPSVSS